MRGAGEPLSEVFRISNSGPPGDTTFEAHDPAVVYDPDHDHYAVSYAADQSATTDEDVFVQLIAPDGTLKPPVDIYSIVPPIANDTDIDYNSATDEFIVVWRGTNSTTPATSVIQGRRGAGGTGAPTGVVTSLSGPAAENVLDTAVTVRSGSALPYVVGWAAPDPPDGGLSNQEIFIRPFDMVLDDVEAARRISGTSGGGAFGPAFAFNPGNGELLVAFHEAQGMEGNEIFVQRLDGALGEIGDDQQISSAGPPRDRF